jgi:hypothetical protein
VRSHSCSLPYGGASGKNGKMSPDQLEQIKEVFYAAMEQSVERRAEFLAEACAGDLAARAEVERLLR